MQPLIESNLLVTFLSVSKHGNFTKAAEDLGVTQSAVSLQIRKLEEMLGEALFDRQSRGVELTRAGVRLVAPAQQTIDLLLETAAGFGSPELSGVVRIGIPEEYVRSKLPRLLGRFSRMHAGVDVTIHHGSSLLNIQALERGELDMAIIFEPGQATQSEILMTDPSVWVTSATHEVHLERPLPIGLYVPQGWCSAMAVKNLRDNGIPYRAAYMSEATNGLLSAAQAGLAIVPISRSNIPEGCRELTAEDGFEVIDFSNVVLRTRRRSPSEAVAGMADAIREAFREQDHWTEEL